MRQDVLDVQDLSAEANVRNQPVAIVRDIERVLSPTRSES
jgi:hypothetical protein